jgi:diaminopimelate decarboxylase
MAVQTRLDECLSIRDGRLFVEECDADALARRFGTPVHIISEDQLRRNARRYRREFEQRWTDGPVLVLASIKANFALATRWILTPEGLGCDSFGAGELHAALEGGVPPERISVNGSIKDAALIAAAVQAGARITLDSAAELDLVHQAAAASGRRASVRLRIRPDFSGLTQPTDWYEDETPIGEAARLYKAGIPTDDALELGRRARRMPEVDLTGVHAHIGRHTNGTAQWPPIIRAYITLLAILREAWDGWTPAELNLGGGYPVPRDPFGRGMSRLQDRAEPAPDLSTYAEVVTSSLRDALRAANFDPRGIRLEIEPGRGIYGNAGIHLATLRNIKTQRLPAPQRWVEHLGYVPSRRRLGAQSLDSAGRQQGRPAWLRGRRHRRAHLPAGSHHPAGTPPRCGTGRFDRLPRYRRVPGRPGLQLQCPAAARDGAGAWRAGGVDQASRDRGRRL